MLPIIVSMVGAALVGAGAVVSYNTFVAKSKSKSAGEQASKIVQDAEAKAKEITLEAKTEALRLAEASSARKRAPRPNPDTEKQVLNRQASLDQKLEELRRRSEKLRKHEAELDNLKDELREIRSKQQENLEKIAAQQGRRQRQAAQNDRA